MSEYKRCPCGVIPEAFSITGIDGSRYAEVACGTCGEWTIEFRTHHYPLVSDECIELAERAWNRAPRGGVKP